MATDNHPIPKTESDAGLENLSPKLVAIGKTIGFHALLWSLIGVVLCPVFWLVVVSLHQTAFETFLTDPLGWVTNASLDAYHEVWYVTDFRYWFRNSLIVSIGATILTLGVGTLGAYSLGRLRYPGRTAVATFLLVAQMVPLILLVIPLFLILRNLGLYNTLIGLVIVYVAFTLPFAIWMLRGFYENLPESLEEAAMIDGSTRFGAVVRVILPVSKPAVATTAIFTWMLAWNEFVFALVLLEDAQRQLLPPGMAQWVGLSISWDMFAAAALSASLPVLLVFFLLQRYIVTGLTAGAFDP